MASNSNGNRSINSGNDSNMSSTSTPTNDSLSSPRLTSDSPRRSVRLSSNSPQIGPRSIMQSNIHRTVSGGIGGSLSPKINNRKKSSLNSVRGNLSNTVNQFLLNDDINNDNGHNYTTTTSYSLPSDQSDDEEMEVNNNNNNNNNNNYTTVQPVSSKLATRAEVLSHFDKQTNGYNCKHCDKHLKLLAFTMNLAESSMLHKDTIKTIELLIDEFDRLFPVLYSEKTVTSVIHSLIHMPQSIKDFGPIYNYSTFNFESVIGSLVQSVNGPNLIVSELCNNINIMQRATAEFNNASFNRSLKLFIRRSFSSKRHALPTEKSLDESNSIRFSHRVKLPDDHMVIVHLRSINVLNFIIYKTCWKNNIRFSMYDFSSTTKYSDSCVLFKTEQSEINCGFIMAAVSDSKQDCYVVIHTVRIDHHDSLTFKKKRVINPFIFLGHLTNPTFLLMIHIKDIIVKLTYSNQQQQNQQLFQFFQFSNTAEST